MIEEGRGEAERPRRAKRFAGEGAGGAKSPAVFQGRLCFESARGGSLFLTPALRLGCDLLFRSRRLLRCGLWAGLGGCIDGGWFVGVGFPLRWRWRNKRDFGLREEIDLAFAWDIDVPGKG